MTVLTVKKTQTYFCSFEDSIEILTSTNPKWAQIQGYFSFHLRTYCNTRMSFRLQKEPTRNARPLQIILSWTLWIICLVQKGDFVIIFLYDAQHVKNDWLLYEAWVTLKLFKCHFFQVKVDYIGPWVMQARQAAAFQNVFAIKTAPFSTERTEMRRSLLGARNVYEE